MPDAKRTTVEIYLIVDTDGNYAVGNDQDSATERFTDEFGDDHRLCDAYKLNLSVPLPEVIELTAAVPDCAAGKVSIDVSRVG